MLLALIAPFSTETFCHQYGDIPSSEQAHNSRKAVSVRLCGSAVCSLIVFYPVTLLWPVLVYMQLSFVVRRWFLRLLLVGGFVVC